MTRAASFSGIPQPHGPGSSTKKTAGEPRSFAPIWMNFWGWPRGLPNSPNSFTNIRGVHLQNGAPEPMLAWIQLLREKGCPHLLWEPWELFLLPENRDIINQILPLVDVFSPGLAEARILTGLTDPQAILRALQDDGARTIALRMGAAGSLVGAPDGARYAIPAVPVPEVIDVTGAGNGYCGGFLVGLDETGDPRQAGCYGAVSASLAIEQFGALFPTAGLRRKAETRLAQCG